MLDRQIQRMLADPKARALVDNFAGQWLYLRNLRGHTPDQTEFPDFDNTLRSAMLREMELFFDSIIREDRSVLDLMTADYTFVNERLARHYGIPNVYGSHFRRVTLTDERAPRPAGQGRDPRRHLVRAPHLAGRARQMDSRKHRRHAAAAAAARCAGARGEQPGQEAPIDARAARGAPQEPGLRAVPPADGSDRLCARAVRRGRSVAEQGIRIAD